MKVYNLTTRELMLIFVTFVALCAWTCEHIQYNRLHARCDKFIFALDHSPSEADWKVDDIYVYCHTADYWMGPPHKIVREISSNR